MGHPGPNPDETLDGMFRDKLRILQKRSGYRFSMDPILLTYFANPLGQKRVLDLGSGCGIIPLILGTRGDAMEAVGVEMQEALVEMASRSAVLNGLQGKVRFIRGDFRRIQELFPAQSFHHVTANPPYHDPKQGRSSPHRSRALARHEWEASLEDVVRAARHVLGTKGRFWLTYTPSRLPQLLEVLTEQGFSPRTIRFVHGRVDLPARMTLVEAVKGGGGGLRVLPPLVLYTHGRNYTPELEQIYRMI